MIRACLYLLMMTSIATLQARPFYHPCPSTLQGTTLHEEHHHVIAGTLHASTTGLWSIEIKKQAIDHLIPTSQALAQLTTRFPEALNIVSEHRKQWLCYYINEAQQAMAIGYQIQETSDFEED